jgi:hypothetical protein
MAHIFEGASKAWSIPLIEFGGFKGKVFTFGYMVVDFIEKIVSTSSKNIDPLHVRT